MTERRPCRARALGTNCVIPGDPVTGWCPRHDPEKAEERQFQALHAARTSHSPRALKLFGPEWDRPDFTSSEARIRFREEVAVARGRGDLDDKAATTLLKACDGAMADDQTKDAKPAPQTLIVEMPGGGDDEAPMILEVPANGTPGSQGRSGRGLNP